MPSHLKQVVAPHMGASLGLFVAARQPCIGMAASPPARGRLSQRVATGRLDRVRLPPSYAVAVVLCPGDDTAAVTGFAARHDLPDERFYFFYAPGPDMRAATAAWRSSGRAVLYSHEISDWKALNQKFGAFWNAWIHDDHCQIPGCRMR